LRILASFAAEDGEPQLLAGASNLGSVKLKEKVPSF
jgi:hypothetical protein